MQDARRILRALAALITGRLQEEGAKIVPPHGGFYVFLDFSEFREKLSARGITTSAQLCERLLNDTGVAILPGSEFGRRAEELSARMAYVDFDGRKALSAASDYPPGQPLDDEFAHKHCGRVVEAVERVCTWLSTD